MGGGGGGEQGYMVVMGGEMRMIGAGGRFGRVVTGISPERGLVLLVFVIRVHLWHQPLFSYDAEGEEDSGCRIARHVQECFVQYPSVFAGH